MKRLLYPASLAYQTGSRIKNFLYGSNCLKPRKAPLPVISIGNISFGGSEKTPLAIHLLFWLIEEGKKPAFISRGYRGKWENRGGILSDGKNLCGGWKEAGEEPFMAAQNIPRAGIFVGKNRLLSCQKAKECGFDVAVLDDAFQHRKLHRDLDIVLMNPSEKILWREPLSSLSRAHVILMKKSIPGKEKRFIQKRFPKASFFEYSVISKGLFGVESKKRIPLKDFPQKEVLAFSGIARPERFLALLSREGLQAVSFLKFPDHYLYPRSSLKKIEKTARLLQAKAILTTEKDAVKISGSSRGMDIPFFYLKIGLEIEKAFYEAVRIPLKNSGRNS